MLLVFKKNSIYFLIFLYSFKIFSAQSLDSSFGDGIGYVTTQNAQGFRINKIRIQSDQKIVGVGYTENPNIQAIVARYSTDGTLDATFGTNGIVTGSLGSSLSTTIINDVAIQTDGKIVVVGYTYERNATTFIFIGRYTSVGALDNTFGSGGVLTFNVGSGSNLNSVAMQSDGKIVVVGNSVISGKPNALIARITSTGSLDGTFGIGGVVTALVGTKTNLNVVKLDSSQRIVVGGSYVNSQEQFILARYSSAGALDGTFGTGGAVLGAIGNRSVIKSLDIDGSGKIVVGGFINFGTADQFVVGRYTSSGVLDTATFNSPTGYLSQLLGNASYVNDLIIQADNKIVVGGYINFAIDQAVVARYNSNGTGDTTFGSSGVVLLNLANGSRINGLALQSDQRTVSGGYEIDPTTNQAFALVARFNKNNTDFVKFNSPLTQDAVLDTKVPTISGTSSAASANVQVVINGVVFTTVATDGSGNWNAGTSSVLPVGTNRMQINLIVAAVTVVSNEIEFTVVDNLGEDSVFAYSTTTQTTGSTNTFQTITFVNPPPIINTWTFNGTNTFTCNVEGKYLIIYSGETGIAGGLTTNANVSLRTLRNGSEIVASQANNQLDPDLGVTAAKTCSRSFIINLSLSDTIQFQYATDTANGGIFASTGNGTTRPSIGITITRLE